MSTFCMQELKRASSAGIKARFVRSRNSDPERLYATRRLPPAAPGFRSIVRYAQRWGFLAKDETGEEIFCGVFAPSPRSANDRVSYTSKVVSFGALSDE